MERAQRVWVGCRPRPWLTLNQQIESVRVILLHPPSPFGSCFNIDGEEASAK